MIRCEIVHAPRSQPPLKVGFVCSHSREITETEQDLQLFAAGGRDEIVKNVTVARDDCCWERMFAAHYPSRPSSQAGALQKHGARYFTPVRGQGSVPPPPHD